MNVQDIAKVCHEVNAAFCHSIGEDSQLPWDQAPEWQKESAIKGVQFIIDNPSAPASATHDSWLAEKKKDGWSYGKVKDPAKKEHPCIVAYDKLPTEQQSKDHVFGAVVRQLLPHLGVYQEASTITATETLVHEPKIVTSYTSDGKQIADLSLMTAPKIA